MMEQALERKAARLWLLGTIVAALLVSACAQSAGAQQAGGDKDREIAALRDQVAGLQQDSRFWSQLAGALKPVEMASMTDHRAYMLPSGAVIALHFDNLKLDQAKNLNWVALGIPGAFTKADQERVEGQFGKGFTHFHDMKNDTHGGKPGAEGVWFVHMAVRDFDSPMSGGGVKAGVDGKFMPTPPSQ
ncbi:MAG: hypothetical protein HYY02_01485 [Chloroflexi bacterium]|nr:hypothetical protein [Chloroflexota bacterium]